MTERAIDYLLIGHITADLTTDGGRLLGGTVSYAARTAASFGLRVGILTSAAENEPLLNQLDGIAKIVTIPAQQTTTFENIYEETGRRQFVRGVATPISREHIPSRWRDVPLVHLAPIANEVDAEIAYAFPEATVLMTLQGWLRRWDATGLVRFRRWFDADVLRIVDLVVFSEEDIAESPDLEAEISKVARHLVVTRAHYGGTYYSGSDVFSYEAVKVPVVDPTGAGDIFAASLICAWHHLNGDIRQSIQAAAMLAAHSVTREGVQSVPTADEVRSTLAKASQ